MDSWSGYTLCKQSQTRLFSERFQVFCSASELCTIVSVRDNDVEVRGKRNRITVFRLAVEAVLLDSRSVDYQKSVAISGGRTRALRKNA
jgi:hypothetical protein